MKKMFLFSLSIFAVFVIGGCSDSDRNKILGLSNDEVAYRFESNSSPNPSQQSLRSFDVQSTLHQESFEGFMTSISVFKDDKLSLKDFSVDLLNNIGEIDDTNNPENGWSYGYGSVYKVDILFFFSTTDGNTYISNGSSFIGNIKVYISNSKNTALVEVQKGTGGYKTVEGTVYELAPSSQHSFFDQYPYLKYLKIMEVQYNIDEIMKDEDLTSGDKIFLDIYLTSLKGLGAITPQRIRRFAIDVN